MLLGFDEVDGLIEFVMAHVLIKLLVTRPLFVYLLLHYYDVLFDFSCKDVLLHHSALIGIYHALRGCNLFL